MEIGDFTLGPEAVYIVAEVGKNHNGDMHTAKTLIEAAAAAGVNAVKFQCYSVGTLLHSQGVAAEPDLGWLDRCALSDEDFGELKRFCDNVGITFLATPEDYRYVDLLDELGVPAYKVSSLNINNFPLLRYIVSKKKPVILSTGMSSLYEVAHAWGALSPCDVALLHCVSQYPAGIRSVNLRAMDTMRKRFNCPVGFSDHTEMAIASRIAVAAGADIIEVHITLDHKMEGPDHSFSLTPEELATLVVEVRAITELLGTGVKKPHSDEVKYLEQKRRCCVAAKDIQKGETFREEMIVCLCPGSKNFLSANSYYSLVDGRYKAATFIEKGTPIQRKMVKWGKELKRRRY